MKQLLTWLTNSAVFGATEINVWCKGLPPSHHITLFPKGITSLSRISGKEHKAMCRFLLGLITNIPLPGGQVPLHVIRATRALLDFTFLAQFPSHMTATLCCLEEALKQFHNNKDVFLEVGVRNISIYRRSIAFFTMPDLSSFSALLTAITRNRWNACTLT